MTLAEVWKLYVDREGLADLWNEDQLEEARRLWYAGAAGLFTLIRMSREMPSGNQEEGMVVQLDQELKQFCAEFESLHGQISRH
jgi:hypothetical protein